MQKTLVALSVALLLAACGGGDDTALAVSAQSEAVLKSFTSSPAALVNTTTAGDQLLRSVGRTSGGGYTVAWLSQGNASQIKLQRFDAAGNKVGTETTVALAFTGAANADAAFAATQLAVLADGGVAAVYGLNRDAPQPNGTVQTRSGVYVQRFNATGAQVTPETTVVERTQVIGSRSPFYAQLKAVALSDGGFAVGYADVQPSSVNIRTTFYHRRFDAQGQAVGAALQVGTAGSGGTSFHGITPDQRGGYAVMTAGQDDNWVTQVTVTYVNAAQVATRVIGPRPGAALLLPLAGGRFLLFSNDGSAIWRQMVDASGAPVGERRSMAAMPFAAQELADGTIATLTANGSSVGTEQLDNNGATLGATTALAANGSDTGIAALLGGGFVAAWSVAGAGGDQDVFAQRVLPAAPSPGCSGAPAWNSQTQYTAGDQVSYQGNAYKARGVNFTGIVPTNEAYWTKTSCGTAPSPSPAPAPTPAPSPSPAPAPACGAIAAWNAQTMYTSGNVVSYQGGKYTARGVNFTGIAPTDQAYWTFSGGC